MSKYVCVKCICWNVWSLIDVRHSLLFTLYFYVFFHTVTFYYSTDLQAQYHNERETKFKLEYLFEFCYKD